MSSKKKTLEEEINEFYNFYTIDELNSLIHYVRQLADIYDDSNDEWIEALEEEDNKGLLFARTAYLISKISDFHAGKLATVKFKFKDLWKRMERVK